MLAAQSPAGSCDDGNPSSQINTHCGTLVGGVASPMLVNQYWSGALRRREISSSVKAYIPIANNPLFAYVQSLFNIHSQFKLVLAIGQRGGNGP